MKRLLVYLLIILVNVGFVYHSQARMNVVTAAGGSTVTVDGTCATGIALVLIECDNVDLTVSGCSRGDTSLTQESNAAITDGWCVFDDTSTNGNDKYDLTVSSEDILEKAAGTVFIRFKSSTYVQNAKVWKLNGTEYMYLQFPNSTNLQLAFDTATDPVMNSTHTDGDFAHDGTEYIVRIRWRATGSPNSQLTLYNTSMTQLDDASNDTDYTWVENFGAGDYELGNDLATPTGYNFSIDYVHQYEGWIDSDPNV